MRIYVADHIASSALSSLRLLGPDLVIDPDATAVDLEQGLGDCEILVVRSTQVSEIAMKASPKLGLIVRAGAGISNIDVNAATANGVFVADCPGKNAQAVAELAIGLLVALDRRIVDCANDLRAGIWSKRVYSSALGLHGLKLGILGLGATGQALASTAGTLGMKVFAWSRSLTPQRATVMGITYCATPLELARQADAISIHLAANAYTYHFVDRKFLSQMRRGAYLVNTSHGALVDTAALKIAIAERGLRVALDVFENEPDNDAQPFTDTELAALIIGTPHIAASTQQAAEAVAREVVRVIGSYVAGGMPINALNAPRSLSAAEPLHEREYAEEPVYSY